VSAMKVNLVMPLTHLQSVNISTDTPNLHVSRLPSHSCQRQHLALSCLADNCSKFRSNRTAVAKTDISRVISVRPFAGNNEDTHRTFIRGTSYLANLVKFASIFQFWVQSDMNNRKFTPWPPYIHNNPASLILFTTETECVFSGVSVEAEQFTT